MKYFILLIAICFSANTYAGNDGGSGGDAYGKEFEMLGRSLLQTFQQNENHPVLRKWNIKPSLFEMVINTTVLRSADRSMVVLDGREVDAIKNPDTRQILINEDRWRARTLLQRIELVLHEYLGILGVERDQYQVTNELSDLVVQTYNRVKNSKAENINLFYGHQKVINSVNSQIICNESSLAFKDALELAKQEALAKCALYNSDCKVRLTEVEAIISPVMIGYKYCSVTVIAK